MYIFDYVAQCVLVIHEVVCIDVNYQIRFTDAGFRLIPNMQIPSMHEELIYIGNM